VCLHWLPLSSRKSSSHSLNNSKTLWATILEETKKLLGQTRGRDRTKIAELFADERVLDFLATTDVGRTAGPTGGRRGRRRPVRPRSGKTGNARSSSHC